MVTKSIEPGIKQAVCLSGMVRYRVRIKGSFGKWLPCKHFERLVDAKQYKARLLVGKNQGSHSNRLCFSKKSCAEYFVQWFAECRGGIKQSWKEDQSHLVNKFILPVLGNIPLNSVAPRDIGDTIEYARSKKLASQTLRHIYNIIRKAFQDAVEHFEYLQSNPALHRYRPSVPRITRQSLTPEQSSKLLDQANGHWLKPALMLGLLGGLRVSEIQALRWTEVDLDRSIIIIKAAYDRRAKAIQPFPKQKNWGQSVIPLPLHQFLVQFRIGKADDEFVVVGQKGSLLNYNVFSKHLKILCKSANLPILTIHELRHSCTEIWARNGASTLDCGRQLNHKNSATTERYMHRNDHRLISIGSTFELPNYAKAKLTLVT